MYATTHGKHILLFAACLGVCLSVHGAKTAHASPSFSAMSGPGDRSYVPVGLNLGGSFSEGQSGFMLGLEASAVYLDNQLRWIGAYADVIFDFSRDSTRLSIGPEFGALFFGFDAGPFVEFREETQIGIQGRALVAFPILSPYVRGGKVFSNDETFVETGVLIKFPIPSKAL